MPAVSSRVENPDRGCSRGGSGRQEASCCSRQTPSTQTAAKFLFRLRSASSTSAEARSACADYRTRRGSVGGSAAGGTVERASVCRGPRPGRALRCLERRSDEGACERAPMGVGVYCRGQSTGALPGRPWAVMETGDVQEIVSSCGHRVSAVAFAQATMRRFWNCGGRQQQAETRCRRRCARSCSSVYRDRSEREVQRCSGCRNVCGPNSRRFPADGISGGGPGWQTSNIQADLVSSMADPQRQRIPPAPVPQQMTLPGLNSTRTWRIASSRSPEEAQAGAGASGFKGQGSGARFW